MNPVVEEMQLILKDDELAHYGMPRRSGRYPWGSGEDPYQRNMDFLARYDELKKKGMAEVDIAREMGMFDEKGNPSTGKLRLEKRYCNDERRIYQIQAAKRMKEKEGMGNTEIGRELGLPESTVRSLLDPHSESRTMQARNTAEFIKQRIDEAAAKDPEGKGMIDIGSGADLELRVSKEKLTEALYILEREGYPIYKGGIPQPTNPGQQTNQKIICSPGTEHKEIYQYDRVKALNEEQYISRDGGDTFEKKFYPPASLDSKRLMIRYADDVGPDGISGIEKDGIVELRRGVPDLSLGESRYSQVRIMVDGTHYIKGMAVYSDNMPDGVDVIFNTNKEKGTPALGGKDKTVLKNIKKDPDNPFGSLIKDADQGGQYWYDADTGKRCSANDPTIKNKKLGLINKRADEGDWDEWSNALPSQFLGKQSLTLAKKQLNLAKADKQEQFDEIMSLTNPTIKKHLLKDFANTCDSAAVHLKAAALPGQKYHVIVPINTLKDNEVYAPNYESGTKLALIRYPHGGTFEIPILTVNNKNKLGKQIIGDTSIDAVGINKKIADRLSGADFDGDTVMAIPTHDPMGKVKIKSTDPLKELEGFDPKMAYGTEARADGYYNAAGQKIRPMTKKNTQTQMGVISNLITDMTLAGASREELARAVKHSMVVIDAEKHKLDYKSSEIENNIAALKKEYQRTVDADGNVRIGGASTILSRAKGEYSVNKRQGSPYINDKNSKDPRHPYDPTKPEGAYIYKEADDVNLLRPIRTVNKKTGVITLTSTTGEKIKYDPSDEASRAQYQPIKKVDKDTGEVSYVSKSGKITYEMEKRTQKSTRMAETDDAYTLVSDARHPMELLYADYANSMKAMANQARKEILTTGKIEYDPKAKAAYAKEVSSLNAKLNNAEKNKPRERAALRIANAEVAAKQKANPDMEPGDIKKARQQAVSKARQTVGSASRRDRNIEITDREWEAIQAGAVSENTLVRILNNTDVDKLKQRAMPRATTTLSTAKVNTIKAMSASNYTIEQIARKLGVSTSTVSKYMKGKGKE